jgi:hypothetical protein
VQKQPIRILLAVAVLQAFATVPAEPARPAAKLDPMLHRLIHGMKIDASGRRTGLDPGELQLYARVLAIDLEQTPPIARIRMKLDDGARHAVEKLGVVTYGALGGFASAVVPIPRLKEIADLPGIEWIEIGRQYRPNLDASIPAIRADQVAAGVGARGAGVLVGMVDTGVDWRNPDFRNRNEDGTPGTTRIKYLWSQDDACVGTRPPVPFDFGCLYTETDINAALGGGQSITAPDAGFHGSHVLGIAGGNGHSTGNGQPPDTYVGVASHADLIVVKTFPEPGDASCATCFDLSAALDFIDAKAAERGEPYSINMSLGTDLGAHDGSESTEVTIDALTGPGKPGKVVSVSAGNIRGAGIHASGVVSAGGTVTLTFTIPSYTALPGIFNDVQAWELWYANGDNLTVTLKDPTTSPCGGAVLSLANTTGGGQQGIATNSGTMIIDDTGSPAANGARFFDMEIDDQSGRPPCPGTWSLDVRGNTVTQGGRFDTWIWFSSFGSAQAFADWNQPDLTELISMPATSFNATSVAAFVTKKQWIDVDGIGRIYADPSIVVGALADFSSPGPTRDGRIKPDIAAPGMGVASALASDAAASILGGTLRPRVVQDGVHWVIEGTSMAAPHVTGVYAQMLGLNPRLDAVQLRALAKGSALQDAFTGATLPNNDWGAGKLDALGSVQALIKSIPDLSASSSGNTFTWSAIPTATTYNAYRGTLSLKGSTYYGTCFAQGLPSPSFSDPSSPPAGDGYFYLVTGVKDGIEGLLGFAADGVTPLPNNSPCP